MSPDLMAFIHVIVCLKKIKDGAYVINLDEYADVGTHWIALYVLDNDATLWCLIDVPPTPAPPVIIFLKFFQQGPSYSNYPGY